MTALTTSSPENQPISYQRVTANQTKPSQRSFWERHKVEILTGIAVVGVVSITTLAIIAFPPTAIVPYLAAIGISSGAISSTAATVILTGLGVATVGTGGGAAVHYCTKAQHKHNAARHNRYATLFAHHAQQFEDANSPLQAAHFRAQSTQNKLLAAREELAANPDSLEAQLKLKQATEIAVRPGKIVAQLKIIDQKIETAEWHSGRAIAERASAKKQSDSGTAARLRSVAAQHAWATVQLTTEIQALLLETETLLHNTSTLPQAKKAEMQRALANLKERVEQGVGQSHKKPMSHRNQAENGPK